MFYNNTVVRHGCKVCGFISLMLLVFYVKKQNKTKTKTKIVSLESLFILAIGF